MTHSELDEILATLGLTRRALARMTGWPEMTAWVQRRASVPEDVSAWVLRLHAWMRRYPPPQRAA